MNRKVEKFLTIVVVIFILVIGIYCFDFTEDPRHFKFNYKVANYHTIERCLDFTNTYSRFTHKNSKASWHFRNILFKQYLSIKESYPNDFYNSIGLFHSIVKDFVLLSELNENSNIPIVEKALYKTYKKLFLSELRELLFEYRARDNSIENFVHSGHRRENGLYLIPNRISFYLELASLYYMFNYKGLSLDDETLEELNYIYKTFDIVYNQEKQINSIHFKRLDTVKFNKKQFDTYYPLFVLNYTRGIILLTNNLHPETDVCGISDVCEKYNEMCRKLGKEVKIAY